jgi:hypothetical protein
MASSSNHLMPGPSLWPFCHFDLTPWHPQYGLLKSFLMQGPSNSLLVIFLCKGPQTASCNLFRCMDPQMASWTSFSVKGPSNGLLVIFFGARALKRFLVTFLMQGTSSGLLVIFFEARTPKWPPGYLFRCKGPQMVSW